MPARRLSSMCAARCASSSAPKSSSRDLFTLGLVRRQEARKNGRRLRPFARFTFDLLLAGAGELVELRLAVVVRHAPRRLHVALLFELEERGVERAVVDEQLVAARLLDAARDAV